MRRSSLLFATALTLVARPSPAAEWDDLRAQYQIISVIGGAGLLNGDNNPNEWNAAEGMNALSAELSEPHYAMEDIQGRVFVADKNANAIRRIDTDGTIHTVAGINLEEMPGSTLNSGYNGDGPARQCLLSGPQSVYTMPDGTFYIGDTSNRRVRRVDANGYLMTILSDPDDLSRGLWVRRDHQLIYYCTINASGSLLRRWTPVNGTGPGTVVASGFVEAGNIDVDAAGNIYVTDRTLSGVYRVPPNYGGGPITDSLRVAGLGNSSTVDNGPGSSGLPATSIGMRGARGVAFHPLGGFFVATHRGGDIWYVDTAGRAWMFVQGDNGNTHVSSPQIVPTPGQVMSEPRSVSVGISGNVLIACNDAGFIRIIRNVLPAPAAPTMLPLAGFSGGMQINWQSDPLKWYLIEQTGSLSGTDWRPLAAVPATGAQTSFTDFGLPVNDRRFYRLRSFRAWPN